MFDQISQRNIKCFSNRGTSGIDGTLSTAIGAAKANPNDVVTVITGDLSFFYDSNALWITPLPSNIKIILINNKGGSIFRIIDGPSEIKELEPFFEVKHDLSAEYIAKTFGVKYLTCSNLGKLKHVLSEAYMSNVSEACIVEVNTDNELNPEILKAYFKALKSL